MPTTIAYIIFSIIAVVFVFLFAIEKFSRQLEKLAGSRFKSIIQSVTSTPLRGTLIGTAITAILQSSTATTVIAVSLVEGGLMTFRQSLGVIFGANIGTTITTQLIAFQLLEIAPFILVLGFLLMKTKTTMSRFGKPIFYFGLLFSTLFIISVLVEPLKQDPWVMRILTNQTNIYVGLLIGMGITVVLQSSALISGIMVILAGAGLIGFEQAFAILLGTNIGTTSTALIASSIMGKEAKRAAMAHFLFNVLGVVLIFPFLVPVSKMIMSLSANPAMQVSLAHILFNVASAILGLIGIVWFEKLVLRLVK
jgi:phosphate:Na+ symporter